MQLEEGYSSDDDQSKERTAEHSDGHDDNAYQKLAEQPRTLSQHKFLHVSMMTLVALYYYRPIFKQ